MHKIWWCLRLEINTNNSNACRISFISFDILLSKGFIDENSLNEFKNKTYCNFKNLYWYLKHPEFYQSKGFWFFLEFRVSVGSNFSLRLFIESIRLYNYLITNQHALSKKQIRTSYFIKKITKQRWVLENSSLPINSKLLASTNFWKSDFILWN